MDVPRRVCLLLYCGHFFSVVIPSSKTLLCSPDIMWLADVHPEEPDGWIAFPASPPTPVQGHMPPIPWWLFCLPPSLCLLGGAIERRCFLYVPLSLALLHQEKSVELFKLCVLVSLQSVCYLWERDNGFKSSHSQILGFCFFYSWLWAHPTSGKAERDWRSYGKVNQQSRP